MAGPLCGATVNVSKSSVAMADEKEPLFSFIAMEYYWLVLNRTYRVVVTEETIYGVRVRGVMSDIGITFDRDFTLSGRLLDPMPDDLQDPASYEGESFVRRHEAIDLDSDEFLEVDEHNFRLDRSEVGRVTYNPEKKWGMGDIPHSGRLVLHLENNEQRELILLGDQDGEHLKQKFRVAA